MPAPSSRRSRSGGSASSSRSRPRVNPPPSRERRARCRARPARRRSRARFPPARRSWRRRAGRMRSRSAPRVRLETPSLQGSIALKGGRIDDVVLMKYRETVDPKSPHVELFSPSGRAASLLRRVWLGAQRRPDPAGAWDGHRMEGRAGRRADARPLPSRCRGTTARASSSGAPRGRSRLSLHRHRRGREQDRTERLALSLRAHLAPRPAQDAGFLHPARGPDRRDRQPRGSRS